MTCPLPRFSRPFRAADTDGGGTIDIMELTNALKGNLRPTRHRRGRGRLQGGGGGRVR